MEATMDWSAISPTCFLLGAVVLFLVLVLLLVATGKSGTVELAAAWVKARFSIGEGKTTNQEDDSQGSTDNTVNIRGDAKDNLIVQARDLDIRIKPDD